ncbi:MAG: hypothetical protein AB1454_00285 [Candidatus Auribacterota bacterium]
MDYKSFFLTYFTLRSVALICISGCILGALFVIKVYLKGHLGYTGNVIRKLVHISVALWSCWAFYVFDNKYAALTLPLFFIAVHVRPLRVRLYRIAHLEGEYHAGTLYFPVAVALLFWFCWDFPARWAALIGLLNMGIGDPMAALIGSRYGKRQFSFGAAVKSYVGSSVMFITCFMTTMCMLWRAGYLTDISSVIAVFCIAASAAILEAISGNGLDNLSVPLGSAFIYSLFYQI